MFTEYDDGMTRLLTILAVSVGGLLACMVNGLIGMVIGKFKGNGKAGFWFGFLLCAIGWIITALLPDNRNANAHHARPAQVNNRANRSTNCPLCGRLIESITKRCPSCGEDIFTNH